MKNTKKSENAEKTIGPRSWWGIASGVIFIAVPILSFLTGSFKIDGGSSPEELEALFRRWSIASVSAIGIGLLLRGATHGGKTAVEKWFDGVGKLVGVGGWGAGMVSTVLFAYIELPKDQQEMSLKLSIWLWIVPGMLVVLLSIFPIRSNTREGSEVSEMAGAQTPS